MRCIENKVLFIIFGFRSIFTTVNVDNSSHFHLMECSKDDKDPKDNVSGKSHHEEIHCVLNNVALSIDSIPGDKQAKSDVEEQEGDESDALADKQSIYSVHLVVSLPNVLFNLKHG